MQSENTRQSVSRRCTHTTASGHPCRAWAIRGSRPPICSIHARRPFGEGPPGAGTAGAPPGNQNRVTHGFYATVLSREELADVMAAAGLSTLEPEIACARVALRRLLTFLNAPGDLPAQEQARLVAIAFNGVRTIARLLREHYAIVGKPPDPRTVAVHQVLDELSEQWGVSL